jgi:hypothetical protein
MLSTSPAKPVHEIFAPIEKRGDHNTLGTAIESSSGRATPCAHCTNPGVRTERPMRDLIARLAKADPRPFRAA